MKIAANPVPILLDASPLRFKTSQVDLDAQPSIFGPFDVDTARRCGYQRNGGMIPLGSGHEMPRPLATPGKLPARRVHMNLPDLVIQVGSATIDGPLPTLVRAESQSTEDFENESWQETEIPEELGYIDSQEPEEIRNIVQESYDEHRALRASKLHTQAIVVRTTVTMSSSGSEVGTVCPSVQTSATASIRSPDRQRSLDLHQFPVLSMSSDRSSPVSQSLDSTASVGSSNGDDALNNLRTSAELCAVTSSQESLESTSRSSWIHAQKHNVRPNQGLFRLLGRKPKGAKCAEELPAVPRECTSCFDDVPDKKAVNLPCSHQYCRPCFSQLVSTAMHGEDIFPPKCCIQEIPRRTLETHLSASVMSEYDEKALEYAVAVGSRYYCGSPECAKWIDTRKARRLNGALECPRCKFWMCSSCRGAQHAAKQDCPQDFSLSATLAQAERAGWRRCYSCRTMVELSTGCRHITCKCKAEFWYGDFPGRERLPLTISSYTCGARWRTCECTEADQALREAEIAERLAAFNAELHAEEAEVREAIAAVERAERQVAAEREAEERELEAMRQAEELEEFTRREYARVEAINARFGQLRATLARVLQQQKELLAARHGAELKLLEQKESGLRATNLSRERSRQIILERKGIVAVNEKKLAELHRTHRTALTATLHRHREDQDRVFLQPLPGGASQESQRGHLTASVLDLLMDAQSAERHELQAQHERDLRKWIVRGEAALREFDELMRDEMDRFERVQGVREAEVRKALEAARVRVAGEVRWWEVLEGVRGGMVDEDERRAVLKGGDAPVFE